MIQQRIVIFTVLVCMLAACGQVFKRHEHQKMKEMELDKISNKTAKAAIAAWQGGDSTQWLSLFTEQARLLDDGHPRDFKKFSTEAIGTERFTSIDKVEEEGTAVLRAIS